MCFPVSYAAIFLGILPVNLLTYDHASVGWVEYGRDASGEQKDAQVAEKYLIGLFCAAVGCCDRRTVRNGDPALRTGKRLPDNADRAVPAGGQCVAAILLINGIIPAAAATALGPKKPA